MNTIFFSSRWVPAALTFLLLALPAPSFGARPFEGRRPRRRRGVLRRDGRRLGPLRDGRTFPGSGRASSRAARFARVLGLDLVKESELIKDRPFLQLFAYAQVFKGGELNFSFAEHYSGLVAYRTKRDVRWTPGLEWHAAKVKRADFAFFDFVLVNGEDKDHRGRPRSPSFQPVTGSGRWRPVPGQEVNAAVRAGRALSSLGPGRGGRSDIRRASWVSLGVRASRRLASR